MDRMKRNPEELPEDFDLYVLDLLTYRPVSDVVARKLNVMHQSPQLLLIANGECVYHASHSGINIKALAEKIRLFQN